MVEKQRAEGQVEGSPLSLRKAFRDRAGGRSPERQGQMTSGVSGGAKRSGRSTETPPLALTTQVLEIYASVVWEAEGGHGDRNDTLLGEELTGGEEAEAAHGLCLRRQHLQDGVLCVFGGFCCC